MLEFPMEYQTALSLLLLLMSSSFLASFSASSASGDADVMSVVARSLSGVPANWESETDPCNWVGINCTAGRITSIKLSSKSISGTLHKSIAALSSLQNLDLGHNRISGPIPSLTGLSSLQTLHLEANAFTSVPGDLFTGFTGLQSVTLDDNPLAPWSIPLVLSHCVSLKSFSASNATITGRLPDVFGQLSMTDLNLSYNSVIGNLPSSLADSGIQSLSLNNQQKPGFSGKIDLIGAMRHLQVVWLQSNSFTGAIPDLSSLTSLKSFNIRDNRLTGPVPPSLISCSTLKEAVLSNNMLQGPLPKFSDSIVSDVNMGNRFCNPDPRPCDSRVTALLLVAGGFGYPLELAREWQGNNPCSDQWTGSTVTCDAHGMDIVSLNFAGKNYTGTISLDIAKIASLTKINLRDNNLTGSIPSSLTKLPHLQLLDVTNNNLTGKIPEFPPSVSLRASNNPLLRNDPILGNGDSVFTFGVAPTSSSAGNLSGGSSYSRATVIGGIIAPIFAILCCSGFLIYYHRCKNCTAKLGQVQTENPRNQHEKAKMSMTPNERSGASAFISKNAHVIEAQIVQFQFQTLLKATNDFSEANILGRGEFGLFYKGEHNGVLITVKRNGSYSLGNKGKEDLRAEVDVVKKIRHRCLVALLGYCINGNESLLVYEYMPKGTLGQHLFHRNENGYSALSWKQRLTIALDVARGIEYLHDLAQESFVHRGLNSSNILLDKDMRAKVSNFGFVKRADSEKSTQARLTGTVGYLAPEYALTGNISTKVDVYAFGVILMELITSRTAIDDSLPDRESHLVKTFRRNILNKEKFMNHVDPTLDLDEEAYSTMSNVAELAFNCTAREPNLRPDMGHVVNMLVPFVEKWNPFPCNNEVNYSEDSITNLSQKLRKWQLDDGTSTWQFDDNTEDGLVQ